MNNLTVVTPVYNRKELLIRLMDSLSNQTSKDFNWLIIDDGSTDGTKETFQEKLKTENTDFRIRYVYKENGGKQRAVNDAVNLVNTDYIFIVDSDDILVPDAIEKIITWINDPDINEQYAGVSGIKADMNGLPLGGEPTFEGKYVDCTNLERNKYNLVSDMAEVYKTAVLKKYPFKVWEGEKFIPEAIVWDKIAENNYLIRWYKDVIYLCDYQDEGLTKGSWRLLRDNPMGYAQLFEHNFLYATSVKNKIKNIIMMDSCLISAKNIRYLLDSQCSFSGAVLLPLGYILAKRRQKQFKKYITG